MVALLLSAFWAMQVIAALFQKWGSTLPDRWWYGFLLANLFGAPSLLLSMKVYEHMKTHPNIAMALIAGGPFLCAQLAMFHFFPSRITALQVVGLAAVAVGMALAAGAGARAGS
jgi:hypothetical protein